MADFEFRPVDRVDIETAFNKALFAAQEQILTDCNFFVKVDQGTLKDTSYATIDGMELTVCYDQPYAKRQYYTGTPSHDVNPNASLRWCQKAQDRFGKDWEKQLERGMSAAL